MRVSRDLDSALARRGGRQLLRRALEAGPVEIRVGGVSMRPHLRSGDRVRLDRVAPRRGHVALVELADRVVLHRLVRHRRDRWLVRGDARPCSDGWVAPQQILAVATARSRRCDGNPRAGWVRLDHQRARALGLLAAPLARIARLVGDVVCGWRSPGDQRAASQRTSPPGS
jgi:hypothetical protein